MNYWNENDIALLFVDDGIVKDKSIVQERWKDHCYVIIIELNIRWGWEDIWNSKY